MDHTRYQVGGIFLIKPEKYIVEGIWEARYEFCLSLEYAQLALLPRGLATILKMAPSVCFPLYLIFWFIFFTHVLIGKKEVLRICTQ